MSLDVLVVQMFEEKTIQFVGSRVVVQRRATGGATEALKGKLAHRVSPTRYLRGGGSGENVWSLEQSTMTTEGCILHTGRLTLK